MRQHVVYILNICMTLTFDPYVGGGGIFSVFTHSFYLVNICFQLLKDYCSYQIAYADYI